MVEKQNEAEGKKGEAEKLSAELAIQDTHIAEQKAKAECDLAEAEPALLDAQASVRSIKKAQLDEVRTLARPPPMVKLTMEAVACMLGESAKDWTEIRRVIRKDDFIPTVVNFESKSLKQKTIKLIRDKYLSDPAITVTVVVPSPASTSCDFDRSTSILAVGCATSICFRMVAPSLVMTTSPMESTSILSMPLGPKVERTASATAFAAAMLLDCAVRPRVR